MKKSWNSNGKIVSLFSGVAKVEGLAHVGLFEVVLDEQGLESGIVIGFNQDIAEVLLFDENFNPGKKLVRGFKQFSVPASESYLGRVVNGIGVPIDGLGPPITGEARTIFNAAPPIIERETVNVPLSTGIKIIDAALPLGRGQRELIIGDRKLGKTTLATDIVLNQKGAKPEVICIYVLCGQKEDKVKKIVRDFNKGNAFLYSIVVASSSFSSFAQTFLAPFIGCTLAEYFRDLGKDALIVYDDLSQHAKSYRDIALILERAPGRETYPGDIFSLHASLLERAGKLSGKRGGGSLTALPIIETQESDVTGFIPTNLISITDGQIYLENGLFQKGFLPAVNVGMSVSRIGSAAQPEALKQVTGGLRLILSEYKELQKLVQLETTVSKEAQAKIHRGELLLQLLKQDKNTNVSWMEQVVLFLGVEEGLFDSLAKEQWLKVRKLFLEFLNHKRRSLLETISKESWNNSLKSTVKKNITEFKEQFLI